MAKQPISTYVYYTKEEALAASANLGCSGYRTYLVDGVRVYLPCDEVATFEKLTSYSIVKGMIVPNGNQIFGGNLVGLQLTTNDKINGDAFFTLGNFGINTSVVVGGKEQPFTITSSANTSYTAESITNLTGSNALDKLSKATEDKVVKVNFDKTLFNRYTLFGSLSDKIKFSIIEITEKYPAALTIKSGTINKPSLFNYSLNIEKSQTSFKINTSTIFNPFGLIYQSSGYNLNDADLANPLRNLTKYYGKYDFVYRDVRYEITGFASSSDNSTIMLTVSGFPFVGKINNNNTLNDIMFIVPKREEYLRSMDQLSDMGKYLLNKRDPNSDVYSAEFRVPSMNENGDVVYNPVTLFFPKYDKYNIDVYSNSFDEYLTQLNEIANDFDTYKTNLVSRYLTAETLKEFDTDDRKIDVILKSYGRTFDVAKQYIDALAFMTKVSYDRVENIPDTLLKNFARTLGWKTYEIEDENTIAESLFDLSQDPKTPGDITPAELDIEIWRRLLLNTSWMFKSKGTRQSIDAILKLVGVPELIYEINEYVSVAQNKIDYDYYRRQLFDLSSYPIDKNGYPTIPTVYFQSGGGNVSIDSMNSGPYDYGQAYIDAYRKFKTLPAFDVYETIDNKKSWVSTDTAVTREDNNILTDTKYDIRDSRLVINTKKLDVFIGVDRIMDSRVYKLYNTNNIDLSNDYPQTVSASALTFNGFLRECVEKFINPMNRKTIVSYPTLTKVYYDYISKCNELGIKYVDYTVSLDFLQKYDTYWVDLIKQFVPATAILSSGKRISNSKLNDNKFTYKHGQAVKPVTGEMDSDIDWLGTDGSEFQQFALKPVIDGQTEVIKNIGEIGDSYLGVSNMVDINGYANEPVLGKLDGTSYYEGNFYRYADFCDAGLIIDSYTVGADHKTITANMASTSTITIGEYIKIYGAVGTDAQELLNGIWLITDVNTSGITFTVSNYITKSETYVSDIGTAIIGTKMYLENLVDFYCPPILPHVCYYTNKDIGIDDGYFNGLFTPNTSTDSGSVASGYTSNGIVLTNMTLGSVSNPYLLKYAAESGATSNGVFTLKKVFDVTNSGDYIVMAEILYENLILYDFLTNDIYDEQLNPIITLTFKQNSTSISDDISFELTPSTINGLYQVNSFRFNALLKNTMVGSVDLVGTIKIPDLTNVTLVTRNFSKAVDSPFGPGNIKILGHNLCITPAYSESISGTTVPTHFIEDWFKNNYFIQQPKYYGLSKTTNLRDNQPDDAVVFDPEDDVWLVSYTTKLGEINHLNERVKTDPLMHIPTIYSQYFLLGDSQDEIILNLTQDLKAFHAFPPTIKVDDQPETGMFNTYNPNYAAMVAKKGQIGGIMYLYDDFIVDFDGMYPTVGTMSGGGPGPIYRIKSKPEITSYLYGDIQCPKNKTTYITLAKPTENFNTATDLISLGGTSTSYYQVNNNRLFDFKVELIFDSDNTSVQDVMIALVDNNQNILYSERKIISSSKNKAYSSVENRTILVEKTLFVDPKLKVYWTVKPLTADCVIKKYEDVTINPQTAYDAYSFVNIIPAKWEGYDKTNEWNSLYYNDEDTLGLPTMFLSYGEGGYNTTGSVSKSDYLSDMESFTNQFRYAKDFYYDTIIFETIDKLEYKSLTISPSGGITINNNKVATLPKQTFEYLPFYSDKINSFDSGKYEHGIGLINYSAMFDISDYADFGSLNWGKKNSPGLIYDVVSEKTSAQNERIQNITNFINGKLDNIDIDPLDYAYSITGPFGLDGIKNSTNVYPFGLVDKSSLSDLSTIDTWPYVTISTNENVSGYPFIGSGPKLETYAIVSDNTNGTSGLLNMDTYYKAVVIVVNDDGVTDFRQLNVNSSTAYSALNNWKIVSNPVYQESIFTARQNLYPQIDKTSLLKYLNPSLKSSDNEKIYISDISTDYKLIGSFLGSTINVSGINNGYLPRGLSNTTFKYRRYSHAWVFGSTIDGTSNLINLYSPSYTSKSVGSIDAKINILTMTSKLAKNLDNNSLTEYSNAKGNINGIPLKKYGTYEFYKEGDDLKMKFLLEKNTAGIPYTGEFIGRLTLKDLSGNISTTFLRLFFMNDLSAYNIQLNGPIYTDIDTIITSESGTTQTVGGEPPVSRTVVIKNATISTYGLSVSATSEDSKGNVTNTMSEIIAANSAVEFDFYDGDTVTITYTVANQVSTVSTIDIIGINDTWNTTGYTGTKTFSSNKLTNSFNLNFTLKKVLPSV